MIRKSFIASALVVLVGIAATAPAMANDVRIEQYGWSNSAGGAQEGYGNRIAPTRTAVTTGLSAISTVAKTFRPSVRRGMTITAPPIRTAAATWLASGNSAPTTPPSSPRTATATSRPVFRWAVAAAPM